MKTLLLSVATIATLFITPKLDNISNALNAGNVNALASYFDESVEIAVLEEEDMYDKDAAKTKVSSFFSSHTPKSFEIVHKGTSKNQGAHYVIGKLITNNETYRVYLFLKENGDDYLIQEIRFEQ